MSSEKKIITTITVALLLISLWLLSLVTSGMMDKPFTSTSTHVLRVTGWTQQDKLYYYWSNSKTTDDANFVELKATPLNYELVFRHYQENLNPETIYLHIKKNVGGVTTLERFETNYYISSPAEISMDIPEVLTNGNSELTVSVRTNERVHLRAVHFQLSDNIMGVQTAKELLQYRALKSFSKLENSQRTFNINLDDYNVGDGRYHLKITTIDASGKVTIRYSDAFVVDFGLIRRAVSFDTPIVGPDGQLEPSTSIQVTGDLLMRFELDREAPSDGLLESVNKLTFFGNPLNPEALTVRRFDGELVEEVFFLASEQKNAFKVKVAWNLPNDWYYVYAEDTLVGLFLCQINRN